MLKHFRNHILVGLSKSKMYGASFSLAAFLPFTSAVDALSNANAISEGIVSDQLRNFVTTNLPKKLKKFLLGVSDAKLGGALSEQLNGLKVKYHTSEVLMLGVI